MFELAARCFAALFFGGWGVLVLDQLATDAGYDGPSRRNTWPAIYGLSLISVGVGFLILP